MMPRRSGRVLALVGAESTGKTTLAHALTQQLLARGMDAVMVSEHLREFCDTHARTPRVDEQSAVAAAQTQRIAQAAQQHDWVVADTTALMTAVYSEMVFGDSSLYDTALRDHACSSMTLLMALDVAWVADGLQRDGPHVRDPVDALIRQALGQAGLPYAVVSGQGDARVHQAMSVVEHLLVQAPSTLSGAASKWRWYCEHCDDGECEQHGRPASLQAV